MLVVLPGLGVACSCILSKACRVPKQTWGQGARHYAQEQREFLFYSASVLLVYEGDAATAVEARVAVRLIDFAHTFPSPGARDENCLQGLESLRGALCRAATSPEDP